MKRVAIIVGVCAALICGIALGIVFHNQQPITPTGPTIVAVYENVEWYPPCSTSPITVDGHVLYPIPMGDPVPNASFYPMSVAGGGGEYVIPPGPGDDIGTVTLYSDGFARFVSHSGNVAWLTSEVQAYNYVC